MPATSETRTGGAITATARGCVLKGTITWPNAVGTIELTRSRNGRELTGEVLVDRGPCATVFFPFNSQTPVGIELF